MTAFVCVLAAMAGCGGPKEPAAAPAATAAPFVVAAVDVPLATSDVVAVYWTRTGSADQIFNRLEGCARGEALPLVAAPYGGGGLPGNAIYAFAQKVAGPEGFSELILKRLVVGTDPLAPGSGITIGDDANEYFDAYVARTIDNELVVLLVIIGKP